MKKLFEYALYTVMFGCLAGFGFASGAAAFYGWIKFLSRVLW